MEKIKVEDAIGKVLLHDMTQIIPGKIKDARFRKGHIITKEDIPVLKSMGKEHIFVSELNENMMHEDDAAQFLCDICINDYMYTTEVKEGKIEIKTERKGYLQIDRKRLYIANSTDDISIGTIKEGNVEADEKIAGMRVIPLTIEKQKLVNLKKQLGNEPLLKIVPYKLKSFGIVVTGSEVYHKRIEDKFSQVIEAKFEKFGVKLVKKIYCDDDKDMIVDAIKEIKNEGTQLICCLGGMSVDPDDLTPYAIKSSGADVVKYGTPFFPGAMFMLAYFDDNTPIVGLPGCVMYSANTVFDVFLPKILAGIKVEKEEFAALGYGGLCRGCSICHFPNCSFGN